jgi:hypothetical protein
MSVCKQAKPTFEDVQGEDMKGIISKVLDLNCLCCLRNSCLGLNLDIDYLNTVDYLPRPACMYSM